MQTAAGGEDLTACYLAPAVQVVEDVGGGRGAGVVAREFIKAGKLLAWRREPLVWSSRASPACDEVGGVPPCSRPEGGGDPPPKADPQEGGRIGAPPPVTACDCCLKPYDHRSCTYTGVSGREGAAAKRCSACKSVFYCSSRCQRDAWPRHKAECGLFANIRTASNGRGPSLTQRLLLRLLLSGHKTTEFAPGHGAALQPAAAAATAATAAAATAAAAKAATATAEEAASASQERADPCGCVAAVRAGAAPALSSHLASCAASAALLQRLLLHGVKGEAAAAAGTSGPPSAAELTRLLHLLSANVHSIISEEGAAAGVGAPSAAACGCCRPGSELAVGLYGQPLCRFNHSCMPNAFVVFGGPLGPLEVSVLAARSIPKGEEICISYVSPANSRQQRQKKLLIDYGFVCTCVLCCSCNSQARAPDTSSSSNSSSSSSSSVEKRGSVGFSLAEAFDLQMRGLFCSSPSCVAARSGPRADVLLAVAEAEEQLLQQQQQQQQQPQQAAHSQGPPGDPEGGRGQSVYFASSHPSIRRRRMRPPVLLCSSAAHPDTERPLLLPAAAAAGSLEGEEDRLLGVSADVFVKEAAGSSIHCCACGAAYQPAEVSLFLSRFEELQAEVQRLGRLSSSSSSSRQQQQQEELRLLRLYSSVSRLLHPSNFSFRLLTDSLGAALRGLECTYTRLTLAVAQQQAAAAAALHGRSSQPAAECFAAAGRLLLFAAQADSEADAQQAWEAWATPHSSADTAAAAPAETTAAAAGSAAAARGVEEKGALEEDAYLEGGPRVQLASQARECLLAACSFFFSGGECDALRQRGRQAEEAVADCERELHALGCG
ncbi:hypothetical protein Efla_007519 [Eimeria flavescens]